MAVVRATVLKDPFVVGIMEIRTCGSRGNPFTRGKDKVGEGMCRLRKKWELEISFQKGKMANSQVEREIMLIVLYVFELSNQLLMDFFFFKDKPC